MDDAMRKALAKYSGPVTKCPTGTAQGAADLRRWAMRRADGKSGVPNDDTQKKITKHQKKLRKRTRQHAQYEASGVSHMMGFATWLNPKARREAINQFERAVKRKVDRGELEIWGDRWPDE